MSWAAAFDDATSNRPNGLEERRRDVSHAAEPRFQRQPGAIEKLGHTTVICYVLETKQKCHRMLGKGRSCCDWIRRAKVR